MEESEYFDPSQINAINQALQRADRFVRLEGIFDRFMSRFVYEVRPGEYVPLISFF